MSSANLALVLNCSVCSRPPAPSTLATPPARLGCGITPATPAGAADAVVTHASGWLKLFWKLKLTNAESGPQRLPIEPLV